MADDLRLQWDRIRRSANGNPDTKPALRYPRVLEQPRFCRGCGTDASAGHRREHGDFLGGVLGAVAAAALSRTWQALPSGRVAHASRLRRERGSSILSRLLGLEARGQ